MKKIWQDLYLSYRFFWLFSGVIFFFLLSYPFALLFPIALAIFVMAVALVLLDGIRLFNRQVAVKAHRKTPKLLSLSDVNTVQVHVENQAPIALNIRFIDELPVQFQIRDFEIKLTLLPATTQKLSYELRPLERGEHEFGNLNLFLSTNFGFLERRVRIVQAQMIPVYPSILQMRKLELRAFNSSAIYQGVKKMRRIGHSYEFDHVKNYVRGDDYRSINWKASSRQAKLMVNKYEADVIRNRNADLFIISYKNEFNIFSIIVRVSR